MGTLLSMAEVSAGLVTLVVGGLLFMLFIFFVLFAARYTKVGPNEVLIVSGRQHTVVDGSGREKRSASAS